MLTSQILLQLIIILLAIQGIGMLCRRIGQPWVVGEILTGLLLGPTLLGTLFPAVEKTLFAASTLPTLQMLGDLGLILYMFALGARTDTQAMVGLSRKAVVVSLSSILLPLIMGATLAWVLYPGFAGSKTTPFVFMLLVGTAMSITAFPVLARILAEREMQDTALGTLALTCAAVNDVVAWCLLALILAVVQAKALFAFGLTVIGVVCFLAGMFGIIRPLLLFADRHLSKPLLLALCTILLLLSAYVTGALGIHPVFGAFLMGIILPRRAVFMDHTRRIEYANTLLFLPLYFVYSGLRTYVGLIHSPGLWGICLLVFVAACLGKFLGGALAFRVGGGAWREALNLGVLMNTRGMVELILLNLGLDAGILSPTLFAIFVLMAIGTTMMAAPLLSLSGYRQPRSPVRSATLSSEGEEQLVESQ